MKTDQQSADQTRALGNGDAVELPGDDTRIVQCLLIDGYNCFDVLAGG